jgi:hypothetical protein
MAAGSFVSDSLNHRQATLRQTFATPNSGNSNALRPASRLELGQPRTSIRIAHRRELDVAPRPAFPIVFPGDRIEPVSSDKPRRLQGFRPRKHQFDDQPVCIPANNIQLASSAS